MSIRKTVLLVEDNAKARRSLTVLLRGLGHEVFDCDSAEEAKSLVGGELDPDVALLDICLPGVSGDVFASYLAERCPLTKIVFVSSEDGLPQPIRFHGSCTFLPKPLDCERLLVALQN